MRISDWSADVCSSDLHVDLEPVVAAIADKMGWAARIVDYTPPQTGLPGVSFTRSIWVALAPTEVRMQELVAASESGASGWKLLRTRPGLEPWTDDFASILPVLRF